MMKIKELRRALKEWGRFWSSRRLGPGFSATSSTHRLCDQLKTGVQQEAAQQFFNRQADAVFVPEHIEKMDNAIEKLSTQCRLAVVNKYVHQKKETGYYQREAELALMRLL
ncbi:hypothetical protein [Alteromonas sp. a30]|uniref:hypothetical protein n=1 Tax=Alteromonas sp. a30 TaxID=2730917 RepID=UPI0022803E12|nr:hypothetical protein [Alteromonas sp. a30]MCY7295112.1 hypothetical protein [Alteromonas sp. a30]